MESIKKNCMRQGVEEVVEVHVMDGTKSASEDTLEDTGGDPGSSPPFPPSTFDRVLLDAPCSALGQVSSDTALIL